MLGYKDADAAVLVMKFRISGSYDPVLDIWSWRGPDGDLRRATGLWLAHYYPIYFGPEGVTRRYRARYGGPTEETS